MKISRYIILLSVIFTVITFVGCNKRDCNGDLDGMWQLMVWTSPDGDTLATKDSMIFYNFQLQMMKFQKTAGATTGSILSMFETYPNAIRIYNPQNYEGKGHDHIYNDTIISGNDTIIEVSILNKFGVPSDGVLNIESLSSGELVLSSASQGTLKFRKY